MAYAIMRASKLSGMGAVAASLQHCHRERETRNADPEQTEFNQHLVDQTSTDSAMGKLRDLLPEKRRGGSQQARKTKPSFFTDQ